MPLKDPEARRAFERARRQTPRFKAQRKILNQRPEFKLKQQEYLKEYRHKEENMAKEQLRGHTPSRKLYVRSYNQRDERKAARALRLGRPLRIRDRKHLYVMTIAEHPGIYKIGRTDDIAARKRSINASLFLTVQILAICENAGHLELPIHDILAPYRMKSGNCREWFKCPVEHIHQTVMSVINSKSALSPEGDPLSPSGAPIRLVEH